MKKKIHPEYNEILFVDTATNYKFVSGACIPKSKLKKTDTFEGKEYPVCDLAVSSSSHPFFTKEKKYIDTEGRVDKFQKKYKQKKLQTQKKAEEKKEEKKIVKKTVKKKEAKKKVEIKKPVIKKASIKKEEKKPEKK